MSHIAFDLDALPLVPKVARSAGIQEAVVGWGLTQMWEWCWREKTDRVTTNHLRGFFGSELGAVLVDFGFLEAVGSGIWRVKGAARYLRITKAQSEAGKKHAGNLKKGAGRPGVGAGDDSRLSPGSLPALPGGDPGNVPGSTATSDERLATSDERSLAATPPVKSPAGKGPKPVDPRYGPLVGQLKTLQPTFTNNDGAALKSLLDRGETPEEILVRFKRGLTADQFSPKCATVLQLLQRWAELGIVRGTGPPAQRREEPATRPEGRVRLPP